MADPNVTVVGLQSDFDRPYPTVLSRHNWITFCIGRLVQEVRRRLLEGCRNQPCITGGRSRGDAVKRNARAERDRTRLRADHRLCCGRPNRNPTGLAAGIRPTSVRPTASSGRPREGSRRRSATGIRSWLGARIRVARLAARNRRAHATGSSVRTQHPRGQRQAEVIPPR